MKDINWITIKEWDIINFYDVDIINNYSLKYNSTCKVVTSRHNKKLHILQWPDLKTIEFYNKTKSSYYQIIWNIETANEKLLRQVKWI